MSDSDVHLDKGWDDLEQGDLAGARRVAEHELHEDPENPEALLLLAACCRSGNDFEEALHLLERASDVAPDWSAPEQWMAEIMAQELDSPAEALEHARVALERAEEEDEFLDAVGLKAGLEIQLGKIKAAQATLAELPPFAEVELSTDASLDFAYLFLEAEMIEQAELRFRVLAERDEGDGEAWYGLGLCAEERGDEPAKKDAWLRVLSIDEKSPLESARMTESEMAEVAEQALKELPAKVHKLIENVPILIVDLPAKQEVEQGLDPRLLGLFEGSAYSDASTVGGPVQVTRILLFRKNLERMAIDTDDLREQIRITLLHETGHFFGMSENDLANVGLD